MTFHSRSILFIPIGIVTLLIIWWVWFRVAIPVNEEHIYTILITKATSTKSQTTEDNGSSDSDSSLPIIGQLWSALMPPLEASWVLLYKYPQGSFYLFEIDSFTRIKTPSEGKDQYRSINENIFFLKKNLAKYYGINKIDFEVAITESDSLDFLEKWGGGHFFNLYSTNYPLGEIYVNQVSYKKFLNGIDDIYTRKLTAQSFWFNLLMTFEDNLPHPDYPEIFLAPLYDSFSANFNYSTFRALIAPLLQPHSGKKRSIEENTKLKFEKNNLEKVELELTNINVLVPYQSGAYDRDKIINEVIRMRDDIIEKENLTITVQIKNATSVNFLAARTAGFFRLRGIDISEYLRFGTPLPRSILLDYANDARKREYIKKLTRIDRVYHMFNYREDMDITVFLGEDLYILNPQNKAK